MKKALFTGVATALVTPFRAGGIDYFMLQRLIERQVAAGVPALVIAGTTGESATLTHEEKLALFERAARFADGRCKIIAGTGCNSTQQSAELTAEAAMTGVDGVLCVTPYYNKCTQDGLQLHYETIADASELPVILYNVPSRTCVELTSETFASLCSHPKIVGLKEANPDVSKLYRLRAACEDALPIYSGNDDRIVPFYAAGACGVISVWSNLCPAAAVRLTKLCEEGSYAEASAIQLEYEPLIDALFGVVNPIPVKAAMALCGFDCGACRLPLTACPPALTARLQTLLRSYPETEKTAET